MKDAITLVAMCLFYPGMIVWAALRPQDGWYISTIALSGVFLFVVTGNGQGGEI